jgi:hypothetical protein
MLVLARERGDRLEIDERARASSAGEPPTAPVQQVQTNVLVDYFRCNREVADIGVSGDLSSGPGYFKFGNATCYGRLAASKPATRVDALVPEVHADSRNGRLLLPFDLSEVVTNLQHERYTGTTNQRLIERLTASWVSRSVYYFLRPILGVRVRRHLQKIRLTGWERIPFPAWPVDTTVETLMRTTLAAAARATGVQRVPFIWFWPDGAPACALMTHDVEGPEGAAFCGDLMDIDDAHGIKAAFQLVPEVRPGNTKILRDQMRQRGFEVNLHDLNHDGYLFDNREQFLERAAQINRYARDFRCQGFRSGSMYREQRWFDAFEVSYDMSVPNVAHLEPQRGGCCTAMPYFVGDVLELPSTTVQDYSLFHILGEYSIRLWQRQCEHILAHNGLMTFITHPDYLIDPRARAVYADLLRYLSQMRAERKIWTTLPREVNEWWRNRRQMRLVRDGSTWRIEGPGSERASLAFAVIESEKVVYELAQPSSRRQFAVQYESRPQ